MRFEKEKTFDLGKRLARWYKNSKKWGKETNKSKLTPFEIIQQVKNGTFDNS